MRRLLDLAREVAQIESRAAEGARHDHDVVFAALLRRLEAHFGAELAKLRVLDFGCGDHNPFSLLLSAHVCEVVGLDVVPPQHEGWRRRVAWEGGFRSPRALVRGSIEYLKAVRGARHLSRLAPYARGQLTIIQYPGDRIPFSDGHFDCVVSNAVLQELPGPLEGYAAEIARVLRRGGFIDLEWHNFYSLHGHYRGKSASKNQPWLHVRDPDFERRLNRLKTEQAIAAFKAWFDDIVVLSHDPAYRIRGVDPDFEPEGAELLTPELLAELSAYPRELLTTRGFIVQGVRR